MTRDWVARLGAPQPLSFASADATLDLAAHVRAASAVRTWRGRLVIVQDDVNALAMLDPATGRITTLLLPPGAQGHRSFSDSRGNKAAKMDLEACVLLPDGRLLALGSGSRPVREQLVVVDPGMDVHIVDGGALFALLRAQPEFSGAGLNIEGAVAARGRLRLFHRGNGAQTTQIISSAAIADFDLDAFVCWLDGTCPLPSLLQATRVDLGAIDGVLFGFTDAAALPDGRIAFVACAEASADTYQDGEILGVRFGILDGADVRLFDVLDEHGVVTCLKLEGIDYVGAAPGGALQFAVVADLDDPDQPAALRSLTWGDGDAVS